MNISRVLSLMFLVFLSVVWAEGAYGIRVVQAGDSLGSIANRYNISVSVLMNYNSLESEVIHPGDVIRVPYTQATGGVAEIAPRPPVGFATHTLQEGESLSEVASHYGITVKALIGANSDISSMDQLPSGIELLIPPSEGLVITLERGQNIVDLLKHYDIDPIAFVEVNEIRTPLDLRAGKMVFLPGVEPTEALERLARVREEESRYRWPVYGKLTSYFGRRNLGMGTARFHAGIDIAAPAGTPIMAARSGTVTYAGWSNRGYGNLVKIRHAGGDESWYAHQSKLYVSVGQSVRQGETIGLVGSTGLSTGPHLHLEIHEAGKAIDPLSYLQ